MEEKTQFMITTEGRIFRHYQQIEEIDPGDALQRAFTTNVVTTTRDLLELPGYGPIHLVAQQQENKLHFSVPLETINFRTTWKAIAADEGYKDQLFPTFADKNSAEPIIEIEWNRADAMLKQDATMRIRFHIIVQPDSGGWAAVDHYLYAFDGRGVAWRLPIANLFNTCQVCMGTYSSQSPTALGAVHKALAQFRTAPWNADLFYNANDVWKFIRFKALDKGFNTQPIVGPWTTMCNKVSTTLLKFCQV